MRDIIQLMLLNSENGVTVREAQQALNISAKTAHNLLTHFGKPHIYKGSGISYILKDTQKIKLQVDSLDSKDEFNNVRELLISWILDGNIDIEAWALDSQKRPPSYFVRNDSAIKLFTNIE